MLALNRVSGLGSWQGVKHAQQFSGFLDGGRMNARNMMKALECMDGDGHCELMCHPGDAPKSDDYAHWGYAWTDELEALQNNKIRQYIDLNKIKLTSFREIEASSAS
jgi:predicted glycoside hydrolase/deacetylase ChbG (UPF0249 family)